MSRHGGFTGRKHSKLTREKISRAIRLIAANPKWRKQISRAVAKAFSNPVIKAAWLKTQRTPEARAKRSKVARASWLGSGRVKRLRKMRTPEWKAHHSKVISENWKRHERQVASMLRRQGWKVLQYGWPDFICVRSGKVMFVEAKSPNHHLSKNTKENASIF
jgi:hypothetical protein